MLLFLVRFDPNINSVENYFFQPVLLFEHTFNLLMAFMKYDLLLLDRDTRFILWQVNTTRKRAIDDMDTNDASDMWCTTAI